MDELENLKTMVREYVSDHYPTEQDGIRCQYCYYPYSTSIHISQKPQYHNEHCLYRRIREAVGLPAPSEEKRLAEIEAGWEAKFARLEAE